MKQQGEGAAAWTLTRLFDEAIREAIPEGSEERALRADVERELRGFLRTFDRHPEWVWSPATVRFVQAVRPKLELLGGPIGARDAGREYGAKGAGVRRDSSDGPEPGAA